MARVLRWWTKRVALMVCVSVGFVDVDGWPTLATGLSPTLGAGRLRMMSLNAWRTVVCLLFIAAFLGTVFVNSLTNSVAASIVLSSSEMVGSLQCAGYTRYVPLVLQCFVLSMKNSNSL